MNPIPLTDATRTMKAPSNWDAEEQGECGDLQICDTELDGLPIMISAWRPTEEELKKIVAGAPILLSIHGRNHPVVSLYTGDTPSGQA